MLEHANDLVNWPSLTPASLIWPPPPSHYLILIHLFPLFQGLVQFALGIGAFLALLILSAALRIPWLVYAGILLMIIGWSYGGYWRYRLRRKFNIQPGVSRPLCFVWNSVRETLRNCPCVILQRTRWPALVSGKLQNQLLQQLVCKPDSGKVGHY